MAVFFSLLFFCSSLSSFFFLPFSPFGSPLLLAAQSVKKGQKKGGGHSPVPPPPRYATAYEGYLRYKECFNNSPLFPFWRPPPFGAPIRKEGTQKKVGGGAFPRVPLDTRLLMKAKHNECFYNSEKIMNVTDKLTQKM